MRISIELGSGLLSAPSSVPVVPGPTLLVGLTIVIR